MINTKRLAPAEMDNLAVTSTGKRSKRRAIARTRNRTTWKKHSAKRTRAFLKTEALTQLNEGRIAEIINTTQPGVLNVEVVAKGKTEMRAITMGSFVMTNGKDDASYHGNAFDREFAKVSIEQGYPAWSAKPDDYATDRYHWAITSEGAHIYCPLDDDYHDQTIATLDLEDEDDQSSSLFDEANEWAHLGLKPYTLNTCDGYVSCQE
jgi:hypothetical protein